MDVVTGATLSTIKSEWIAQPGTMCQLSGYWAAAELQSPGMSLFNSNDKIFHPDCLC
jgi:hypothetical protein